MEIDPITGNDEKVIIIDSYYILDREAFNDHRIIEWKYDRRQQPKI